MVASSVRFPPIDDRRREQFIELFNDSRRSLLTYILSLLPNWNDAQEVLQETSLRLWTEFDRFTPGTDFGAWARRVAYFQVLTFRKRRQRDRFELGDQFLAAVNDCSEPAGQQLTEQAAALEHCFQRLRPEHRSVMHMRYAQAMTIELIARQLGRSSPATYKLIARVRKSLADCIRRRRQEQDR